MTECCATCKHCLTLEKLDYSKTYTGEWREYMDGFVCNVFAKDGEAVWMVDADPEKAHCEMWTERKENG